MEAAGELPQQLLLRPTVSPFVALLVPGISEKGLNVLAAAAPYV